MLRKLLSLLALFAMAAGGLVIVVLPTAMAMPMRFHTPELIERLYILRSWGTTITFVFLAIGLFLAGRMWQKRSSLWAPLASTVPVLALSIAVFFSTQHLIEWGIFAPVETVAFNSAAATTHVDEADYVMAVRVGDESRAYPILMVAYYHIVNDEIDGEPYAVTY